MPAFPSSDIVDVVPSADVATNGTLTFAYPAGRTAADYTQAAGAVLYVPSTGPLSQGAGAFSLAYGASIVATYLGATTIKAGARCRLQVPRVLYGALVPAAGTASNAIADVGAAFNQGTLNNNFASLAAKQNSILAILQSAGLVPN